VVIVRGSSTAIGDYRRLAMEFGREVFGVPGNVTQEIALRRTN